MLSSNSVMGKFFSAATIARFAEMKEILNTHNPAKLSSSSTTSVDSFTKTTETTEDEAATETKSGYDESITLESGEKTDYSMEIDGKVYYYKSKRDLDNAKLFEDPAKTAVGIGTAAEKWGERTEFFICEDGSKWYFASREEYETAKLLVPAEMKKMAVGRAPLENKGGEDVKNNADAVTDLEGEKTDFYLDIDGVRYYYSPLDFGKAAISNNPAALACGSAEVMTEWGAETDYYIDYDGSRYYYATEDDKNAAAKELEDANIFSILRFNKYAVGKGEIS